MINLLATEDARHEIEHMKSASFEIIENWHNKYTNTRFYMIETTEEEMMYLNLKYGKENVWKR